MPVLNKSAKHFLFSACAVVFFLAAAYADLALRARSAYMEGEKYMTWTREPGLKKDFFEKLYADRLSALGGPVCPPAVWMARLFGGKALEDGRSGGRLSAADFEDKKNLLLAEKEFRLGESPAKYAYIWYKTAAADFSPPETRWARLARQKAPEALELWKAELRTAKIDFKDYELE